jgi:hypothetical protein
MGRGEKGPTAMMIGADIIPIIARAQKRIVSLFHYGTIYYEDVFGKKRETPFCFEYVQDYPDDPFVNCPEHNTPEQGR